VDALLEGHDNCMVGEIGGCLRLTPLKRTWNEHRQVDRSLLELAHRLTH
jgi:hypothetical protein